MTGEEMLRAALAKEDGSGPSPTYSFAGTLDAIPWSESLVELVAARIRSFRSTATEDLASREYDIGGEQEWYISVGIDEGRDTILVDIVFRPRIAFDPMPIVVSFSRTSDEE